MKRDTAQLAVDAALIVARRTKAKRMRVYHGTSNGVLKSILSKGLIPGKSKTWSSDKDVGFQTPSRVSYGGIYFTGNFMTALSSSRKAVEVIGGSQPAIIEAIVQPRSALPDEDDFHVTIKRALSKAFGRSLDEYAIIGGYISMTKKQDGNVRKDFLDAFRSWLKYEDAWLPKHLDPSALEARIGTMYEAAVTRLASHLNPKDWDYRLAQFDIKKDARKDIPQPKKADGERMYRKALDAITKTFRRIAMPRPLDYNRTFRMMDPVAYGGRNKITAVIELINYYGREVGVVTQIKVHKGNPARLLSEFEKAIGKYTLREVA